MIEAVMYAAIGFLSATLLALLILPAVWRRAVRLTRRRVEAAIPISLAEIQADKDQARAQHAVELRRLELQLDGLNTRSAAQWERVVAQEAELVARAAALTEAHAARAALEAAQAETLSRIAALEAEVAARTGELAATREALEQAQADLIALRHALEQTTLRADGLEADNAALATLRETLKGRVADLDRHLATTSAHLAEDRLRLRDSEEALAAARAQGEDLAARLARAEAALADATAQTEQLTREVATLTMQSEDLARRTREAEAARDLTRRDAEARLAEAANARRAAEGTARQASDLAEMLRAELGMLEGALAKARADTSARAETVPAGAAIGSSLVPLAAGDDAHGGSTAELRARLTEVAAQVASMVATLEGPTSPIHAILANAPARAGALADRIRVLQGQATGAVAHTRSPAPETAEPPLARAVAE